MGMLDDKKDNSDNLMSNPETREKIEKLARDKGISMESAKEHYMKHGDKSE